MQPSLIDLIQQRIRNQWQSKALSDYQGDSFTYAEVARILSGAVEYVVDTSNVDNIIRRWMTAACPCLSSDTSSTISGLQCR